MFKTRQRFGKYIIERRLGEGGFAVVYQARDTIEGIRVALKIPFQHLLTSGSRRFATKSAWPLNWNIRISCHSNTPTSSKVGS